MISASSRTDLWHRDTFERLRVDHAPKCTKVVVAVDPPLWSRGRPETCGIVAVGRGEDDRAYVLEDATTRGCGELHWATAVARLCERTAADFVVAEASQDAEFVGFMMLRVFPAIPVHGVRIVTGKFDLALHVADLYARGLVSHVGTPHELENQCCGFGVGRTDRFRSSDRVDALVFGLTKLMLPERSAPRIRRI